MLCFCINIVLMLWLDVFVFKINGFVKFGNLRIGLKSNMDFKCLNEFFCLIFYLNLFGIFFFVRLVKGVVIVEKLGINF